MKMTTTIYRITMTLALGLMMMHSAPNSMGQATETQSALQASVRLLDDGTTEYLYLITQDTPLDELTAMQQQAKEVGVDMDFSMSRGDKRMKRLSIGLAKTAKNAKHCWQLTTGKYFNMHIGWLVDAEGDALGIIDENSNSLGRMECTNTSQNEVCIDSPLVGVMGSPEPITATIGADRNGASDNTLRATVPSVVTAGDIRFVRFEKGMTLAEYEVVREALDEASIIHKYSEKTALKTVVKLDLRIDKSTQQHQLKLNTSADWHIDVAWRADETGRAIDFVDIEE